MKLAIVAGLNESYTSSQHITERFTNLCKLLHPLGYQGIELAILEPEKIPVKAIKQIADSYQLKIPALGTGSTYLRFHYSFGDLFPDVRKKAIKRVTKYIEFSTQSDSKVIIGLIRGRRSYKSNPTIEKRNILSSLSECCKLAEDQGVELLFEPINRFEVDSYNTIEETLELIDSIGSPNLKLLIDSFHTHLEENSTTIWDYLEGIADKVSHLHLADDTRRAPGTGHFDFKKFLGIFKKIRFSGFASVETIMAPSFEAVARETMTHLQKIGII